MLFFFCFTTHFFFERARTVNVLADNVLDFVGIMVQREHMHGILWRDRMDVPSKCTVVRATGRSAYKLEATEWLAIGTEATLSAMPETHKRK